MAENNPRLPKRAWRDNQPAGAAPKQGRRAWQKELGQESSGPRLTKKTMIALVGGAFVVVAAVLLAVVFWPVPIKPYHLVLIGAGYETNLAVPANVYGKRGLADLRKRADEYNRLWEGHKDQGVEVRQVNLTGEADQSIADAFAKCKSPTVLVYLSVHGLYLSAAHGDPDGEGLYLLCDDYSPRNPRRYRFAKLLDALKQLPDKTKKLLVLDVTGVAADWPLGLFHNDFAGKLEAEVKPKDVRNLVVLCASDKDQRSWVSEEAGRTIFTHYLIEELKAAAGSGDQVTAQKLADDVSQRVERWVRHNRAAVQKPRLIDADGVAAKLSIDVGPGQPVKDPEQSAPFALPEALRKAWEQRFQLDQSVPHPAVNTPHWWRQYQDTLLRYEELVRAGDDTFVGALQSRLLDLETRIRAAQRLALACRTNTLTMAAALGWSVSAEKNKQLRQQVAELWGARDNAEEFQSKLTNLLKGAADPVEKQLLRQLFLERARLSADDFSRVCADAEQGGSLARLDDLRAPLPRPAEVHFALLMQRDLPDAAARWGQARQALDVRQQAEEAALGLTTPEALSLRQAAYSEQLLPWVKEQVETGDAARRRGEDRLFGSARDAADATSHLEKAAKDYQEVLDRARLVRAALATRDRALAELPYYTRWLARQPLDVFSKDDENQHKRLWENVDDLCARLEERPPAKIGVFQPLSTKVQSGLDALAAAFQKSCKEERPVTQQSWHEIDNLLTVPFIDPTQREELLKRLRDIGSQLNGNMERGNPGVPAENVREAALRQARLAVAVLGKDDEDTKRAAPFLQAAGDGWSGQLLVAGGHVAAGFTRLGKQASDSAVEGQKLSLDKAAGKLRPAALQARRLDGGAVAAWFDGWPDPVQENRAIQLHDLLVWQAQRTYRDYWSSEDEGTPYYRVAGNLFLDDAGKEVLSNGSDLTPVQKEARLTECLAWKTKLKDPDQFAVQWWDGDKFSREEKILHITDERRLVRKYGVAVPAGAPPGELALWPEKGKSLKRQQDNPDRWLLPVHEASLDDAFAPEPTNVREATDQVSGYFRGRHFNLTTQVRRYKEPDLIALQHEWPREASLAVRADPKTFDARSELVIVLDYSASMNEKDAKGEARIDKALKAVRDVLSKVPRGVKVAIMTFSQNEPRGGTFTLRKLSPWNPESVTEEISKLKALKPTYNTPLVRATASAAGLFSKNDNVIKKLVVLTDGGDSTFYTDDADLRREANTIEAYMGLKFTNAGIQLTVIGFEIDEQNVTPAERRGYREFKPAVEKVGGTYLDVKDSSRLAEALAKSLLEIRFQVDRRKPPVYGDSVTYFGRKINVLRSLPVEEGDYYIYLKTKVLRDKDTEEQKLHLRPGDGMVLKLVPARGAGFQFEREVYADSDVNDVSRRLARQSRQGKNEWVLAVWQNQNDRGNLRSADALQMLVTLEQGQMAVNREIPLRQEKPDLVWFRLATGDAPGHPRSGLRFFPLADYPAPAWRLEMDEWPRDKDVLLESWCTDVRPPAAATLVRGKDYTTLSDLTARAVPNQAVRVESVAWEQLPVAVSPGKERPVRNCLVVRLSFPAGQQPFFARLPDDLVVAGYEHRFYTEAGKYTGIFWDVDENTAKALRYLELISVEQARDKAVRYDPINLGKPNNDPAPLPLRKDRGK
jgi:hypothetical protein